MAATAEVVVHERETHPSAHMQRLESGPDCWVAQLRPTAGLRRRAWPVPQISSKNGESRGSFAILLVDLRSGDAVAEFACIRPIPAAAAAIAERKILEAGFALRDAKNEATSRRDREHLSGVMSGSLGSRFELSIVRGQIVQPTSAAQIAATGTAERAIQNCDPHAIIPEPGCEDWLPEDEPILYEPQEAFPDFMDSWAGLDPSWSCDARADNPHLSTTVGFERRVNAKARIICTKPTFVRLSVQLQRVRCFFIYCWWSTIATSDWGSDSSPSAVTWWQRMANVRCPVRDTRYRTLATAYTFVDLPNSYKFQIGKIARVICG